jgi:hypothetical protein
MPSYLDILPEDIVLHIYKMLYNSVLNDMKANVKYVNTRYFNKLLSITKNPCIDNLNYYDFITDIYGGIIENKYSEYIIDAKYCSYNIEYELEHFYNSSLYYKSYYTRPLDIIVNNIGIFNLLIEDLYKNCNKYYEILNDKYFINMNILNCNIKINSNGFILEKHDNFSCLAELLYYILELYNYIKRVLYTNIDVIETQDGGLPYLSSTKLKEREFLIDILNFHINHRYIEELIYDVNNKCVSPQLE